MSVFAHISQFVPSNFHNLYVVVCVFDAHASLRCLVSTQEEEEDEDDDR